MTRPYPDLGNGSDWLYVPGLGNQKAGNETSTSTKFLSGQEIEFDMHFPSGQVNFSFHLPTVKIVYLLEGNTMSYLSMVLRGASSHLQSTVLKTFLSGNYPLPS